MALSEAIPDDIWEAARALRGAVLWESNSGVEYIARALMAEREKASDQYANLTLVIADIREKSGVGGRPMLAELADAIAEKMAFHKTAARYNREQAEKAEQCATEGCANRAVITFERGGIGSRYCAECYGRIDLDGDIGRAALVEKDSE